MAGMFKKATTIKTETPKAKKSDKEQIVIKGLQDLALLSALIKKATAMQETIKSTVNAVGFEKFASMAGNSTRPSSFEGLDGVATASVEVRKRSTGSVLTDEEVKLLDEAGIKAETKVISPHLFAINPAYANNEVLLAKVEKAIEKIVPEDFIKQQEEVSRKVVSDTMLDDAFRNGASAEVLAMLTTMAVKPKLTDKYDMRNLIADATAIMQPEAVGKVSVDKTLKVETKTKLRAVR